MLKLGAVFLAFLFAGVVLGFGLWLWLKDEQSGRMNPPPRRRSELETRCPICGNVYTAIPRDGLTLCPVCRSYNEVRTSIRRPEP